jgi:ferrous iron transport protein B
VSESKPIILVGNPNVGKSVIFGILTGRYVTVSNYPGTTVEVTKGRVAGDASREVIDTPGVNSLLPQSEEEQVTRDILLEDRDAVVVQVGDQKNLPRTLFISLQIAEAGHPFVLCLNMGDEADQRGIVVDTEGLGGALGVEVIRTTATRREGTGRLISLAGAAGRSPFLVTHDQGIEAAIAEIEPLLPACGISPRSLALMLLAGDTTLSEWINGHLTADAVSAVEAIRHALQRRYPRPLARIINERRHRAAQDLAERFSTESTRRPSRIAGWLGDAAIHPVWGVPVIFAVLWIMYAFVGQFGAGTAVDFLESTVFGKEQAVLRLESQPGGGLVPHEGAQRWEQRIRPIEESPGGAVDLDVIIEQRSGDGISESETWTPVTGLSLQALSGSPLRPLPGAPIPAGPDRPGVYTVALPPGTGPVELQAWSGMLNPVLHSTLRAWSPWEIIADFFVGRYGLITMGLTYAVAIVLPIIITFFFAFSLLEDSGYLPRLAAMLNRVFRVMGLNGKAVLPMVLGLGCDTMATLTTRILDSRKERMIAIIILALGVPCSAQLGVILGLLAGLSWMAALVWGGAVTGVILLVGFLASRLIPGETSDFILELPPLRIPNAGNIATKTLARVEWYLKEAVPLFLIGTAVLFVADLSGGLGWLERAFEPVVTGFLGLPARASEALIIGFLRRDFGAAGLYRLAQEGLLNPVQIVVALVTITLFIPCIANLLMIVKERGTRTAVLVAAFIFPFAIAVGGALNYILHALGATL